MVPNGDMGDGEVSRDGKRLAVTFDYGANKRIAWFAVKGDVKTELPPVYPDAACMMGHGDANFADPTWSPDGSGVAFASSNGIEVTHFSAFAKDTCETFGDAVFSGSEPDWGPADPPAAAYVAPGPAPAPAPGPAPAPKPASASFSFGKVTASALRKGLAVKVTLPAAGKATVVATVKGKQVASATAKGPGTITVRLSKVRKSLKGKTLTLKLTF